MSDAIHRIRTDVLVVGGGVAGCLAALSACERGARVVVSDKGGMLERSGSVAGGVDQFLTVLQSGPEWDTPEGFLRYVPTLTDGIVDLAVTRRVIENLPRTFQKLEAIGVNFRDADSGTYVRHKSFGLPGTYHVDFDGTDFKLILGKAVRRAGAIPLLRTAILELLTVDGSLSGALGVNIRTGSWYWIEAKAVVLATGDINRLSKNISGIPFDSWHCPYNTGDGHRMGYRCGAALVNMEFIEATLTPAGFSTQGLNAFTGLGAHLLNRHGERFLFRYDERGEQARRAVLVDAVINEVLEGNGPIYLCVRHLPEDRIAFLERTMGVDRATLPGFYRQKGIDLRKDLIEISVSEFSIRRSGLYYRGSGLAVDASGQTSLPYLFAAGDCASVSGGVSGAASLGMLAGEAAAQAADGRGDGAVADEAMVHALVDRWRLPLLRRPGIPYRQLEDEVREVTTAYLGFRRSGAGIRQGLTRLVGLQDWEEHLSAEDHHELMRTAEARSIRLAAELLARAALVRQESRTGSAHRRIDFPERDDERWRKFVIVEQGAREPRIRLKSADEPVLSGREA